MGGVRGRAVGRVRGGALSGYGAGCSRECAPWAVCGCSVCGGPQAGWGRPTDRMGGGLEAGCAVGR
ncbi:hypothetical protein SUDANB54_01081 [Streptomyces sp. enrichment culture]